MLNKNNINIKKSEDKDSLSAHSIYYNLKEKSTLNLLKKHLNLLSGIYAFIHNYTQKLYIGSSINLAIRTIDHLKNRNSNIHLQRAFDKDGINNFSLYVLEILPKDSNLSYEEFSLKLIQLEQKYPDLFDNKYNINPTAGKTRLGSKHSEATKELMSKLRKENPYFLKKLIAKKLLSKYVCVCVCVCQVLLTLCLENL